jgi:hypothetical protein
LGYVCTDELIDLFRSLLDLNDPILEKIEKEIESRASELKDSQICKICFHLAEYNQKAKKPFTFAGLLTKVEN